MKTFEYIIIICFAVLMFFVGRLSKQCNNADTIVISTDTVYVYDTVVNEVPQYINRYITRIDSVPYYLYTWDTLVIADTIYVPVPIERKEYKTDEYFAIVEGYKPALSYIETYNKTTYVTEYVTTKQRWGLGIQAGVGYGNKVTTYVGVGVQYNLKTW